MAIVAKTYDDYVWASVETWTELLATPDRDYLDRCYVASDFNVRNTSSATLNAVTQCAVSSEFDVGFTTATDFHDWTTQTLVENSQFSEFPGVIEVSSDAYPRFWNAESSAGPTVEIKQSESIYYSDPSSVVIQGSSSCPQNIYAQISQSIPIHDILQTTGTYRLIFYYRSNVANIVVAPRIKFYTSTGELTAQYPAVSTISSGSTWKLYDDVVEIDVDDASITSMDLILRIYKTASGAFSFYMDDVDFHYAFDLDKVPGFPSVSPRKIPHKFGRTADRVGYQTILGGGVPKLRGDFDFYLITEAQLKLLKAAWTFQRGHRLNVESIWPWRTDVSMPSLLWFHWLNDWEFEPSTLAENFFTGKVKWEEK